MFKTLIATSGIAVVFFLAPVLGLQNLIHQEKWIILSFFALTSYLFYRLMDYGMADNRDNFVVFYLANIVIRFVLSLIFIGVELYLGIQDPNLFVVTFFVLYLFYTIFENTNLYRNLRQNS